MLSQVLAAKNHGLEGILVSIECDVSNGLPGFTMVGLGDKTVSESRERLRSAIKNSGLHLPPRKITLNLAPADLPKNGSRYDLGMAVAVLLATSQIPPGSTEGCLFLGELALDGSLRATKGALAAAQLCRDNSISRLYVPIANAPEAALITGIEVYGVDSLRQMSDALNKRHVIKPTPLPTTNQTSQASENIVDFSTIYGQNVAKRAIEIAAAGNHNIILAGPPGVGKTMLARASAGLLPRPSLEELIYITKLHNLAGLSSGKLITKRPFRSPHHTTSRTAMVGGGATLKPGEISLSHGGILFLDEMLEFPRPVLEALRQPLEDGEITVSRVRGSTTFPARFMLVATLNPCPCGYKGDPKVKCGCEQQIITSYTRRLSGPLLDRIDLKVDMARPEIPNLISRAASEPSKAVAQRVGQARAIQAKRFTGQLARTNAAMSDHDIKKYCNLNNETRFLADQAIRNLNLSGRAYTRILKVARTIADLAGSDDIETIHFTEALRYRPHFPNNPGQPLRTAKPESICTRQDQLPNGRSDTTGQAPKRSARQLETPAVSNP